MCRRSFWPLFVSSRKRGTVFGSVSRPWVVPCQYEHQTFELPVHRPASAFFKSARNPNRLRRCWLPLSRLDTGLLIVLGYSARLRSRVSLFRPIRAAVIKQITLPWLTTFETSGESLVGPYLRRKYAAIAAVVVGSV